ncbi:hypothetical protein [Fulvivirga ligni]|uniref:hypothetical protein n=1 Tax=Fulvivirga ligni TaxID=2904246 RepID=UPI001F209A47|nr:hypothetical protein [Fulvivirga ligni]UII22943.1 hypothetical protein LVD16_06870 [Fulvivirga ligni]
MKKIHWLLSLLLMVSALANAQTDNKLLYGSEKVVWCGLDYSKVKCIGAEGFTDPDNIVDTYFNGWNKLVQSEATRYDVKKLYGFEGKVTDLSVVEKRNEMPKADDLVIDDSYSFEDGTVEEIISTYKLEKADSGLGLVYIFESLNKTEQAAHVYVVFFDIASKKILWSNKYEAKAGGFGFRNYWARTVLEAMEESGDVYSKEKKKFEKENYKLSRA